MRKLAYRLYLLFIISWFLKISERVPALGVIRFDLLIVAVIAGLIVIAKEEGEDAQRATASSDGASSRTPRLIMALVGYSIVTLPFVEWPGSVLNTGLPDFIKALVFYYFTAKLITTSDRLRGLLMVFIPAMTFRVFEPVYLHVTTGYWGSFASMGDGGEMMNRLAGAPYDKLNPNGLAFVVLTVIPFFHFIGPIRKLGGLAYLLSLPVLLWALILTGSRSGMVGFAGVLAMIWLKSKRKALLTGAIVVALILVTPLLSAELSDRYRSIFDSKTKNARTASGRMEGVMADLQVAMRKPFFGHGLGTSQEANANFGQADQRSHNLYTETAQELGFVGLPILIATIVSIAMNLRVSMRKLRASSVVDPLLLRLTDAVQVWLAMNILFSFASYGLSSFEWYFAAGLSEVLRRFATTSTAATGEVAATPQPGAARWSATVAASRRRPVRAAGYGATPRFQRTRS